MTSATTSPRRASPRLWVAIGLAASLVAAGGSWVGLDASRTRREVEAVRHQNETLRAWQDALRERGSELAARLAVLEAAELAASQVPSTELRAGAEPESVRTEATKQGAPRRNTRALVIAGIGPLG